MTFWKLFATVIALYVLVNYVILPKMISAWKANRSIAKIVKAGLLTATELVRDLSLIGVFMYALFAVFLLLSLLLPDNLFLITWVVQRANKLHALIEAFKKQWETWYFLIPSAALVYLYWRTQRREFSWRFRRAVNAELDRLNEERMKDPSEWTKFAPDAAMKGLAEEAGDLRRRLASFPGENNSTVRETRQRLLRRISQIEEKLSVHDYERRINPRVIACDTPNLPPRTALEFVQRALVSKGLFDDFKSFNRILPRATFAVVSVALIGVASHGGLPEELRERIVHLDDLRVSAEKEAVEKEWKQAAPKATEAQPQLTAEDRRAMEHLAHQFARALSQNPSWRPFRATESMTRQVRGDLARREILANVDIPEGPAKKVATYVDDAAAGFTNAEQQMAEDLARRSGATESRLGHQVAAREAKTAGSMGSQWQKVKASVLRHTSAYTEPVRPGDLHAALVDRIVSTTVETSVPVDASNEIEKLARGILNSNAKKSVNEAVEIEFKKTLMDLAGDTPFEEAMERVKTRPVTVPANDAEAIALLLEHERMPRVENLEVKIRSQRNWRSVPDTLGDAAEAQKIADDIARRTTDAGQRSLREEAVDALANYDDHFPSSQGSSGGGSSGGGGGGHGAVGGGRTEFARVLERHRVSADTKAFQKLAQVRVQRASSFRMLRGFSRVGGVLIGEEPDNPSAVLGYRDLAWRITGRDVSLMLRHRNGSAQSFGPFDKSLVHQALAYAADGRPVAVTMTKARPLPQLKIHLHPALLDSPSGCRVTELDRFVDTFTRERLPERASITNRYAMQFAVYDFAWAKRLEKTLETVGLRSEQSIANAISRTLSRPDLAPAVEAALRDPGLINGKTSVFTLKTEFFDSKLVSQIRACASSSKDLGSFTACIQGGAPSAIPDNPREQTRLFARAEFEPWSGVRERKFHLADDLAFLRPPVGQTAVDRLWPLDFIIQIAFTSPVVDPPGGQDPEEFVDDSPIEFREIQGKISEQVLDGIRSNSLQPMFKDLQDFTVLQRLFRQILAGRMGDDFPVERLGSLTRATVGAVPYFYTRRWNGSAMTSIVGLLHRNVAELAGSSDPWASAARSGANRCSATIRNRATGEQLAAACDFDGVALQAEKSCRAQSRGAACSWSKMKGLGTQIAEIHRMEYAFGVLKDEENGKGITGCPALAAAPVSSNSERRIQ